MKINNKILSVPPYISTTWNHVTALHLQGTDLVVNLDNDETVEIPGLKPDIVELLFSTHAESIETQAAFQQQLNNLQGKLPFSISQMIMGQQSDVADAPLRLSFSSLDDLGSALHHNPQHANAPELPQEILQKIAAITRIVSPDDVPVMPKPEPHCNCMHCQIGRTIQQQAPAHHAPSIKAVPLKDEEVKDEELCFQQWEINPTGNQLFTVINRLDVQEKYSVYLGHPVGCTCGKSGCEHIIAVLKS